jgi:hypothetical protein
MIKLKVTFFKQQTCYQFKNNKQKSKYSFEFEYILKNTDRLIQNL